MTLIGRAKGNFYSGNFTEWSGLLLLLVVFPMIFTGIFTGVFTGETGITGNFVDWKGFLHLLVIGNISDWAGNIKILSLWIRNTHVSERIKIIGTVGALEQWFWDKNTLLQHIKMARVNSAFILHYLKRYTLVFKTLKSKYFISPIASIGRVLAEHLREIVKISKNNIFHHIGTKTGLPTKDNRFISILSLSGIFCCGYRHRDRYLNNSLVSGGIVSCKALELQSYLVDGRKKLICWMDLTGRSGTAQQHTQPRSIFLVLERYFAGIYRFC